jgi:hypothetical protein
LGRKSASLPGFFCFVFLPLVFKAMKNNRFHRGIGMTPFEALYGRKMAALPPSFGQDAPAETTEHDPEFLTEDPVPTAVQPTFEVSDDQLSEDENRELLDLSHSTIEKNLETARSKQQKQADGMLKSTAMRYGVVEAGTTVRIPVPEVDRSKADPRNVLAVVMKDNNNGNSHIQLLFKNLHRILLGYYQLGTTEGVLPQMFVRTSFEPCSSQHLTLDDVPATSSTTLRNSAAANSQSGGQGFFFCGCKKDCSIRSGNRCKCRKKGLQCNSKCHYSQPCCNK